jgi:hypothetical protein
MTMPDNKTGTLEIIPAAGIPIICIALNFAHKYIYQINDENYASNQVRQVLLLALVALFLLAGSGTVRL